MAYTRLKAIEKMQTDWMGLWYHPEHNGYSSAVISLAELRKFKGNVRIYMRKNKLYERGGNRPNYCFCIKDSQSPTFTEIEMKADAAEHLYTQEELDEAVREATEGMYTRSEVERVMNGAVEDGRRGYGYGDVLIEDYL